MELRIAERLSFSDFEQMSRLEARFYGEDYITPPEEAFSWYRRYPYTVAATLDGGKVAGFVNLFPVTEPVFTELRAGRFNDRFLTLEDIVDISASDDAPLYMFLSCIATEPEYRKCGLTKRLLRAAAEPYHAVRQQCGWILTDTVTEEGAAFSRRYGFSLVCRSTHGSSVYMQRYADFLERLRE